ncbi:MAG: site-specific DNA-methyltransferase [Candidatus Hodarchaeota archaeon]
MVKFNWEGKRKATEFLNSLKHEKKGEFKVIESIISPINENIRREPNLIYHIGENEVINLEKEQSWENQLYWADNYEVMKFLLQNFREKVNLIYFDPPFATGGDFNYIIQIGESEASKSSSKWLRKTAYRDTWKEGFESYLNFMYERLLLMKELLSQEGSIYVHLDWHMGHYIKVLMDELFGVDNFRNEIIWAYPAASVQTRRFYIRSFDVLLFYTKSNDYTFNDDPNIYMEYSDRVKKALKQDEKGIYYYRGGSHNGKKLSQKVYIKEKGIFPRDVWNDIPYVRANTIEYQGFSTQKPERLLKRIILASTNKNDLIADFFCGSGTTLAVAEKLSRRWIGCDIAMHAIHITKKRLLDIYNSNDILNWKNIYGKSIRPFKIYQINKAEKKQLIPTEFLAESVDHKVNFNTFEKPSFKVKIEKKENMMFFKLIDYSFPYENLISVKLKKNIKKWSDWIDYWAIDFDNKSDIFTVMWFSYRTPKNRDLKLISIGYNFTKEKSYNVLIKVIDIFGIETIQEYNIDGII